MNLFILQKEWLDKCEQAKRAKLAEENSTDNVPDNDKHPKEDKAVPSRSMSLDSNTLGEICRYKERSCISNESNWLLFYSYRSFSICLWLILVIFFLYFTHQTFLQLFKL